MTIKSPSQIFNDVHDPVNNLFRVGGNMTPTIGTKLSYDDMNVSNGGIARNTSIIGGAAQTQVYSYLGQGLLLGFLMTLETIEGAAASGWNVRAVVDGIDIFLPSGIATRDVATATIYNFNIGANPSPTWAGLNIVQDTFRWDSTNNLPMEFSSSVKIYVNRTGAINKLWRAGIVCISKQ